MRHLAGSGLAALALVLLATATNTPAQDGNTIGFAFGSSQFDVDDLGAALAQRGLDGLESSDSASGLSAYRLIGGRVVLGLELYGAGQTLFNDADKASVHVSYSILNVGYVAFARKDLKAFPLLGIGRGGVDVRIVENAGAPTFDAVLDQPRRESSMNAGGLLLQAALGVDYFLHGRRDRVRPDRLGRETRGQSGVLFGARVGYNYKPSEASWQMEDRDVLGGPDVELSGPFLRFSIGWARFRP